MATHDDVLLAAITSAVVVDEATLDKIRDGFYTGYSSAGMIEPVHIDDGWPRGFGCVVLFGLGLIVVGIMTALLAHGVAVPF